jgi:uncharacterized protein
MEKVFDQYRDELTHEGMVYLNVKVVPNAQRTQFMGFLVGVEGQKVLKIKVAAVPEKGKANAELCRFFAAGFGVAKSKVKVVQGQMSQWKVLKVIA